MTEVPTLAPIVQKDLSLKHIHPNYANIPEHLIKATSKLGAERAFFIENRVKNLISGQTEQVETVIRNEPYSSEDSIGHDLTVILKGESPLRTVYIQVKSSRDEIAAYKRKLRKKYFPDEPYNTDLVKRWLTKHAIILINGSEIKTDQDILNDSFYPQLQRIQKDVVRSQNTESSGQMKLFRDTSLIQIFPDT
jgi:hypothetical protein